MTVHAPFHFVPLSAFVFKHPEADKISHDIPFRDGLCGSFKITIKAETDLLVGGKRTTENGVNVVNFFAVPGANGKPCYAIPESTLRGMIRNVLEIASFAQMRLADDKRFGIRDLSSGAHDFYQRRLIKSVNRIAPDHGKNVDLKVKAGRLSFDGKDWRITPCRYARIAFDGLVALNCRTPLDNPYLGFFRDRWFRKDDASARYALWGSKSRDVKLWVDPVDRHPHQQGQPEHRRLFINYRKAFMNRVHAGGKACQLDGTLVFTGKTNNETGAGAKKAEFFFLNPDANAHTLDVSPQVMKDFMDIHDPARLNKNLREDTPWKFWKDQLDSKKIGWIPVFYLEEGDVIVSLGLAQMFKLAHENSVHTMIRNTNKDHLCKTLVDLPTALFGIEANEDGKAPPGPRSGLKSRVNFGLAEITDASRRPRENLPVTVLGSPKPSYFPLYVRQPHNPQVPGNLKGSTYATYTPFLKSPEPEVRLPELSGWKRYVAPKQKNPLPSPPAHAPDKVKIKLKPLPDQSEFSATVRFHNLLPWELGAVLWALEWGGNSTCRHRMGMGKPYGLGQVTIKVYESSVNIRPNEARAETLTIADYRDSFVTEMEKAYGAWVKSKGHTNCTWQESEQIKTLLAMADPEVNKGEEYQDYMGLVMGGPNDFTDAKRNRPPHVPLVLKPYLDDARFGNCADHVIAKRVPDQKIPVAETPVQGRQGAPNRQPTGQGFRPGPSQRHQGDQQPAPPAVNVMPILYKKGDVAFLGDKKVTLTEDAPANIGQEISIYIEENGEKKLRKVRIGQLRRPKTKKK